MAFQEIRKSAKVGKDHQIVLSLPQLQVGTEVQVTIAHRSSSPSASSKNSLLHEMLSLSIGERRVRLQEIPAEPEIPELREWDELEIEDSSA